jgi:hypothetical protein
MYQLFIAGIAYLNSLWQAAEQGWTIVPSYVEALLDMQVCTSVMASLSGTSESVNWRTSNRRVDIAECSDHSRLHQSLLGIRDRVRADHTRTHRQGELGADIL